MTTLATINMDAQSPIHTILNVVINLGAVPAHQLKMLQRQVMACQARQEKYEAKQAEKARDKEEKTRLKSLKSRPSFSDTIANLAADFGFAVPNVCYSTNNEEILPLMEVVANEEMDTMVNDDEEVEKCFAEIIEDDEVPENVILQANRGEWEEAAAQMKPLLKKY